MCVPLQSPCGERGHTPAQPCRARAQGASAAPDVPIAVICENADDVAAFDDFQAPELVEPLELLQLELDRVEHVLRHLQLLLRLDAVLLVEELLEYLENYHSLIQDRVAASLDAPSE